MRRAVIYCALVLACTSASRFGPRAHRKRAEAVAAAGAQNLWRDTPYKDGALILAYVEIPKGELRKWEFDIAKNDRVVDRTLDASLGGFPANYGFIPQTVAYDGDPLDVLVLGPALPGGSIQKTALLGIMRMDDEKGPDPKIVLAPLGPDGAPAVALTEADKARIGAWFNGYKRFETKKWAKVRGWGGQDEALSVIEETVRFLKER